jgi:hypothetical protein
MLRWGRFDWTQLRRPASFGRSLRDPGTDRPRLREVGSGRSAPASLGFDRNTPTFSTDLEIAFPDCLFYLAIAYFS